MAKSRQSIPATKQKPASLPMMMKICRLCEAQEGPFLNIFGPDKDLYKIIEELLPVVIDEYDELPHKVCFRCSVKVEQLHEFALKCIQTQENLYKSIGKKQPPPRSKFEARKIWEEKLNKSKMSNDDICNALIQKAMEGLSTDPIKEPPITPNTPSVSSPPSTPENKRVLRHSSALKKVESPKQTTVSNDEASDTSDSLLKPRKEIKIIIDRYERRKRKPMEITKSIIRTRRSKGNDTEIESEKAIAKVEEKESKKGGKKEQKKELKKDETKAKNKAVDAKSLDDTNTKNEIVPNNAEEDNTKPKANAGGKEKNSQQDPTCVGEPWKNITSVQVAGVGYLYTCKVCSRNFLKRERVLTHICDKKKSDKKKSRFIKTKNSSEETTKKSPSPSDLSQNGDGSDVEIVTEASSNVVKKKKPGPASKTLKSTSDDTNPSFGTIPLQTPASIVLPQSVTQSAVTNEATCYRLVPGPNNTFTLESVVPNNSVINVAETPAKASHTETTAKGKLTIKASPSPRPKSKILSAPQIEVFNKNESSVSATASKRRGAPPLSRAPVKKVKHEEDIIDLDDTPDEITDTEKTLDTSPMPTVRTNPMPVHPYPVGLFSTLQNETSPPKLLTPAMKKQTYTVLQTENPSKLVISAIQNKPAHSKEVSPVDPIPTPKMPGKRGRKPKVMPPVEPPKTVVEQEEQPFSVSIVDSTPVKSDNESFFTFINLDPLLRPSYVLPTNNIIQESQISTSTPSGEGEIPVATPQPSDAVNKDIYCCEICDKPFTREKKMLSHLKSHYASQDEDDDWNPNEKVKKKYSRKTT